MIIPVQENRSKNVKDLVTKEAYRSSILWIVQKGSYVSFAPNNFQVMQHWRSTGKLNIVTLVLLVKNVANNSKQLKIYWIIRGVTRHVSVTNVGNVSQP